MNSVGEDKSRGTDTTKLCAKSQPLMQPADFIAWQDYNADALAAREEFSRACVQDAVIRAVIAMQEKAYSLQDAGDILSRRFVWGCRDGVNYTPAAVRSALRAIGWTPVKQTRVMSSAA